MSVVGTCVKNKHGVRYFVSGVHWVESTEGQIACVRLHRHVDGRAPEQSEGLGVPLGSFAANFTRVPND